MAQIVLTDVSVTINSVDLSDHVTSVTINHDADAVEITAMSDTAHKFTGGLENISVTVELQNDYAASSVDATLSPLVGSTTTVLIVPTSAAVGATNPSFTVSDALCVSYQPVSGGVGELGTASVEFQGGTLVRAES